MERPRYVISVVDQGNNYDVNVALEGDDFTAQKSSLAEEGHSIEKSYFVDACDARDAFRACANFVDYRRHDECFEKLDDIMKTFEDEK